MQSPLQNKIQQRLNSNHVVLSAAVAVGEQDRATLQRMLKPLWRFLQATEVEAQKGQKAR